MESWTRLWWVLGFEIWGAGVVRLGERVPCGLFVFCHWVLGFSELGFRKQSPGVVSLVFFGR